MGVKFLASENWCGQVHFGGHSPEWRVFQNLVFNPVNSFLGGLFLFISLLVFYILEAFYINQ